MGAVLVATLLLAACGSSGGGSASPGPPDDTASSASGDTAATDAPTTTEPVEAAPIYQRVINFPGPSYPAKWSVTIRPGPCDDITQTNGTDRTFNNCLSMKASEQSDQYDGASVNYSRDSLSMDLMSIGTSESSMTYEFLRFVISPTCPASKACAWQGSFRSSDEPGLSYDPSELDQVLSVQGTTFDGVQINADQAMVAIYANADAPSVNAAQLIGVWTATGKPAPTAARVFAQSLVGTDWPIDLPPPA